MAAAKYPDSSTSELIELVKPATFLFAAGQETVTKLLSAAVQTLGDRPEFQQLLRDEPDRIPAFIEEAVRMHSPQRSISGSSARAPPSAGCRCLPGRS